MADPLFFAAAGSASLASLSIVAAAGLRGWNGWLELKRELLQAAPPPLSGEVAALKARIRALEAIVDGVEPR